MSNIVDFSKARASSKSHGLKTMLGRFYTEYQFSQDAPLSVGCAPTSVLALSGQNVLRFGMSSSMKAVARVRARPWPAR